jgi:hypothetical protein
MKCNIIRSLLNAGSTSPEFNYTKAENETGEDAIFLNPKLRDRTSDGTG